MAILPRRAHLGLELAHREAGLQVVAVTPGSTGAAAGIEPGDRLIAIAGEPSTDARAVAALLRRLALDASVTIEVERAGHRIRSSASLGALPTERFDGARVELDHVDTPLGRLRSIYTVPDANGPFALVMFLPGGAWTSVEFPFSPAHPTRRLIETLSAAGFSTLRVERSGMGDSEGPPCTEVDFETELAGYAAGLALSRKQSFVAPDRTLLFGASLGGRVAPLIADESVRGAIVYGASACSWNDALLASTRRQAELSGLSGAALDDYMALMTTLQELVIARGHTPERAFEEAEELAELPGVVRDWYRGDTVFGRTARFHQQLERVELRSAWQRFARPVLALVGEHDFIASFDDAREIVDLCAHPDSGAFEVPGTDHHVKRRASRREALGDPAGGSYSEAVASMALGWIATISR